MAYATKARATPNGQAAPAADPGPLQIRWDASERQTILEEAGSIRARAPHYTDLELIRLAQTALPEARRREITSVTVPAFDWFKLGVVAAVEVARSRARAAEAPPPTPEPEPYPGPDPDVLREILDAIEAHREESTRILEALEARVADVARRVDTLERSWPRRPDAESAGFATPATLAGATRPVGSALVDLVKLIGEGLTFTIGRPPRPAPAQPQAQPQPQPAPAAPRPAADYGPPANRAHPPGPATPPPATRKPRAIVLSLESGHSKQLLRDACRHLFDRLDFGEVPSKLEALRDYDLVVATKKTPTDWIAEAKTILPAGRLRVLAGNSTDGAAALKDLAREAIPG